MIYSMRLLEGELLEYNGVVWVVKGFQHPRGYVIAYPRYNVSHIPYTRIKEYTCLVNTIYWDCIGLEVPVIPLDKVMPIPKRIYDSVAMEYKSLLANLTGIDLENIYITGSKALGLQDRFSDIDLVIYGKHESDQVYNALVYLRKTGITRSLYGLHLFREHKKHPDLTLEEYMLLRENSVLQGVYKGYRYSIRLVPFTKGYSGCLRKAEIIGWYKGTIRIIEAIKPYTTPARYIIELDNGEEALMETYRIRYTELPIGFKGYVVGRIEAYDKKLFIVPDHGFLKPVI